MLMELSENEVKPPSCGQDGEKLGATVEKRPEPTVLEIRYAGGAITEMDWIGWDIVFAFVMQHGMAGFRDGGRVVLVAPHWSFQLWGSA